MPVAAISTSVPTVKLNDGTSIPRIGFGTGEHIFYPPYSQPPSSGGSSDVTLQEPRISAANAPNIS